MAGKIRVLIVDDHTLLREGIATLLATSDEIEVAGEAADGKEAIEKTRQLTPDLVLMDLAMPVMDGVEATRQLVQEFPHIKVLVLTQYDHKEYILSVVKAGALGFVPKKAAAGELLSAIKAVYHGDSFLASSVTRTVVDDYLARASISSSHDPFESLSSRQRELLRLIAEGLTAQEIAGSLGLSAPTIRSYQNQLMKRLAVHNRTELVKYAIRKGLIPITS